MTDGPFTAVRSFNGDMTQLVQDLLHKHLTLWWACDRSLPAFRRSFSVAEQSTREKQMEKLVDGLLVELKHLPPQGTQRQLWQQKMRTSAVDFLLPVLDLEPRHLDFIENTGLITASETFARMARRFDPHISAADIYQASRNVMTMNFMQLLLGLPVEVTPSVFAYSMLYPYTDNYLDDPTVSTTTKLAFNHRFQHRLMGEDTRPANHHEEVISSLIAQIEGQWDRSRYPQVYSSLLAIHAGQARSMGLVAPNAAPYELDVLGISFEKGGTSVLADGTLVAGWLTPHQAELMFGYGAFTQLMDDLEDIETDRKSGNLTIFSQAARRWPLDAITYRTIHFGRAIFSDLSDFNAPAAASLKELIDRSIDPVLIDIAGRAGPYYSKPGLCALEQHLPFRFASIKRQREKLERHKVTLGKLIETLVLASENS